MMAPLVLPRIAPGAVQGAVLFSRPVVRLRRPIRSASPYQKCGLGCLRLPHGPSLGALTDS